MKAKKVILSEDWSRSAFAEEESELLIRQGEFTKPFFQFFVHLSFIIFILFGLYDILLLSSYNLVSLLAHYLPGFLIFAALEVAVYKGDITKLSGLHLLATLCIIMPLLHYMLITTGSVSSRYFFIAIILTTIYYIVPGKRITSAIMMAVILVSQLVIVQFVIFKQEGEKELLNMLFFILINLAGLMITYIIQSLLNRMTTIRDSLEDKCSRLDRMQEEFINTLSSLSLGILLLDQDKGVIIYNSSFEKLSGISGLRTGLEFFEQFKMGESSISEYYWQKLKMGMDIGEELTGESDGEDIWLYIKGISLKGEFLDNLYLLILEDISGQKRSKFAQDQNERHLQTVFNQRSNIVLYERKEGELYFTENILHLTGYTSEELCARQPSFESLVLEEDHKIIRHKFKNWVREGRAGILYLWYRIKRRDGKVVWLEERMTRISSQTSGEITTGIFIDNSDLKLIERELKKSESSLRRAQEIAILGNWDLNVLEGKFMMSEELYRIMAIDHGSEESWQNFLDYVHQEEKEEIRSQILRAIDSKETYLHLEFRLINAIDQERWVQSVNEFIWEGEDLHFVHGVIMDISRRKELEGQLFQNQKMEAVGTLAGGIAHDFNNILNIIMGYAVMIEEMLPNDSDLWYKFDRILAASKRARNLVTHILTISRQHTPTQESICMKTLLEDNLELLRAAIPSTIEIKADLRTSSNIFGDPNQIEQIVMNLCTNSYYAMKQKGGKLFVRLFDVKDQVCLEIEDTGSGIPQKVIDKIFDPYFTTKPKGEGTGLGLAIVNGIVEQLGGEISLSSEIGKGTKFRILFQKHSGEKNTEFDAECSEESEELEDVSADVLFIDDEQDLLELFSSYLEANNIKVDGYDSSHNALEAFNATPGKWDVVVSDISLPDIDGIELVRRIRKKNKHIPVIMYSGFKQPNLEETLHELGVNRMLIKPVFPETMVQEIRQLVVKQEDS